MRERGVGVRRDWEFEQFEIQKSLGLLRELCRDFKLNSNYLSGNKFDYIIFLFQD